MDEDILFCGGPADGDYLTVPDVSDSVTIMDRVGKTYTYDLRSWVYYGTTFQYYSFEGAVPTKEFLLDNYFPEQTND